MIKFIRSKGWKTDLKKNIIENVIHFKILKQIIKLFILLYFQHQSHTPTHTLHQEQFKEED